MGKIQIALLAALALSLAPATTAQKPSKEAAAKAQSKKATTPTHLQHARNRAWMNTGKHGGKRPHSAKQAPSKNARNTKAVDAGHRVRSQPRPHHEGNAARFSGRPFNAHGMHDRPYAHRAAAARARRNAAGVVDASATRASKKRPHIDGATTTLSGKPFNAHGMHKRPYAKRAIAKRAVKEALAKQQAARSVKKAREATVRSKKSKPKAAHKTRRAKRSGRRW